MTSDLDSMRGIEDLDFSDPDTVDEVTLREILQLGFVSLSHKLDALSLSISSKSLPGEKISYCPECVDMASKFLEILDKIKSLHESFFQHFDLQENDACLLTSNLNQLKSESSEINKNLKSRNFLSDDSQTEMDAHIKKLESWINQIEYISKEVLYATCCINRLTSLKELILDQSNKNYTEIKQGILLIFYSTGCSPPTSTGAATMM